MMDDNKLLKIIIASAAVVICLVIAFTVGIMIKKHSGSDSVDDEYSEEYEDEDGEYEDEDSALPESTEEATENDSGIKEMKIVSLPDKTEYYIGDTFSDAGMEVIVYYNDGKYSDVTSKADYTAPKLDKEGEEEVKVTYTESGDSCYERFTVTVSTPEVELNKESYDCKVGDTFSLTASTKPSAVTVSWSSNDKNVASVSSSGSVKAVGAGTAIITAEMKYAGGYYYAYCSVSVAKTDSSSTLTISNLDGTYEFDDDNNEVYVYDISGSITGNYDIKEVKIGVYGPVYINNNYEEITQSQTFDTTDFGSTKSINISNLMSDGYFDCLPDEEYLFYVTVEDSSGNSIMEYRTIET